MNEERSPDALLAQLTRSEKISLVHGTAPGSGERGISAAGHLPPIERLDIPPLRFADGPLGVRSGESTAFPTSIALGATFDPGLAREFGETVGAEARRSGIDVLLAPACNLVRVPHCGRSFEYFGEDPYHSGRLASATVAGIQSQDVVATPKHYVANNQERDRVDVSANLSERALRELYLRPFEMAVSGDDSGAGAIMAAYNRVNGTPMTQHNRLLTDVLKDEFGFDGPVLSDWWSVENGPAAAAAGLDLEMPGVGAAHMGVMSFDAPEFLHALVERWPDALRSRRLVAAIVDQVTEPGGSPIPRQSEYARDLHMAVEEETLTEQRLDDMVTRVLRLHERIGALSGSNAEYHTQAVTDADDVGGRELAREIAIRGSVLLKNDNTLPIDPESSIAAVGPNVHEAKVGGGGSSAVAPRRTVSPVEGIRERATNVVRVEQGHPPIDDDSLLDAVDLRSGISTAKIDRDAVRGAVDAVDTAVVVVQDNASEGRDRETLELPGAQNELVETVAKTATQTAVVLQTAGPVEMPWLDAVDAVLELWYPGQEAGHALADILFGAADPGGRLPVTVADASAYPATTQSSYPGHETDAGYPEATYDEGVFVGYRHFVTNDVEPLFPFGHGESYTTFEYEAVEVAQHDDGLTATIAVTNAGDRQGREVVQAYLHPPNSGTGPDSRSGQSDGNSDHRALRPHRELAGFASVELDAGETRTVSLQLDTRAFGRYDETDEEWVVDPGNYTLEVGRSSTDIRLEEPIERAGGTL